MLEDVFAGQSLGRGTFDSLINDGTSCPRHSMPKHPLPSFLVDPLLCWQAQTSPTRAWHGAGQYLRI